MTFCPFTMIVQAPAEKEEDYQRENYSLARQSDGAPEEVRRDRLAHLLLMALKAVEHSPECNAEEEARASYMKREKLSRP